MDKGEQGPRRDTFSGYHPPGAKSARVYITQSLFLKTYSVVIARCRDLSGVWYCCDQLTPVIPADYLFIEQCSSIVY